jgi:transcriptional regulator with XRE-family HTH domain
MVETTTMGQNIENIRLAKRMTREEVIKLTGITNLYMKEKGMRKITEKDINKLAKALDCSKSEIVGDVDIYIDNFPETIMIKRYIMNNMKIQSLSDLSNIQDKIAISKKFLKDEVKSENIIIVKYSGNYMFPILLSNDNVYVDLEQRNFVNNGIFLMRLEDGSVMLRRAFKPNAQTNLITLACENKEGTGIRPTQILEESFNETACGKAVFIGRNISYM